mmetsp:Transcript_15011/g.34801  ORF Transcript_15011/g.34801 Transcript_15011/m.34801 type:complete len:1189 (+) Transcript_15011:85-3651(+)|eukprot:CAMPEP_0197197604 /NCGR_PEP_ID=MMETSP1423-20130617/32953_1 /TAXON_ID=476441 /ORGANISM="Pseudo-nitzschia heimii, Strain UNC1101" /LENGTH=1188 /DNA_ID=CAMNT_0042651429 /DNA_START=22 /DNA_END=3588 /DNA_ORIENTATION=-
MENDENDNLGNNNEAMLDILNRRPLQIPFREAHETVPNDGIANENIVDVDNDRNELVENEVGMDDPILRAGEARGRVRRLFHRGAWERQRNRRARMDMYRNLLGRHEALDEGADENDPNRVEVEVEVDHFAEMRPIMMREQNDEEISLVVGPAAAALPVLPFEGNPENPRPNNADNNGHGDMDGEIEMNRNDIDIVANRIDGEWNEGENVNDDDDFHDFVMMDFSRRFEHRISALRASREYISSGLFDIVKEGRTCKSVLSGWGRSEQGSCDSIVQHCVAHPEDAQYVSLLGRTPLHEACLRGACRHIIRALLEATNNRGARERDHQGNTPLHLLFVDYSSSPLNNLNLVWSPEYLAQVVGDLLADNPSAIASCTNADGDTPLHSACMAPETMVDPSSIVQLLRANPRAATRMNRKNQTPLRLHCQRRNASPEVAGLLLEENPHALIVLDNELGWAPIHAAASNANFKLMRYLVESYPESVKVQTSQRQTALHLLCQHHMHLSTVGPPASVQNHKHTSNSCRSSDNNNINVTLNVAAAVAFLLEADPEAIMHPDRTHGYTPLHLVCKTEGSRQVPLKVVQLLLGCNTRAAGVPDSQNYLPLHHACQMGGNPEVIKALIEAYPDATGALTRKQDSPLSLACTSNSSAETVQLLIKANPKVLTQKNNYGFCPLHCVCRAHQPRMGIVKALVDACPESVNLQTHSAETPLHLASSNTGAFVGVLQLLVQTQAKLRASSIDNCEIMPVADHAALSKDESLLVETKMVGEFSVFNDDTETENLFRHSSLQDSLLNDQGDFHRRNPDAIRRTATTNKMGNTLLHDACFRSTPYENLEVIAKANPEYILIHNNAGYTPLQILCKNGRIDERIISTFAQMGGPEIFSVKDCNGNTPLHLAMRKDVDVSSLRCLIRASPDALRCRTAYGDLPLHLACLRRCSAEVIQEVAIAASSGDVSLAVVPNLAGQTPIGIAMAEFRDLCSTSGSTSMVPSTYRPKQRRIFQVLSTLVKIVYYGPVRCQQQGTKDLSLLKACIVLHRQNIRLDPTFIRQVIHVYPEEVKLVDEDGNYPLHIEASIPIEKMGLLDGFCSRTNHRRMGILRILLEAYPNACSFRNKENHFPLGLMIQAGRVWGHTIAVALKAFPPALHWYKGLDDRFSSILLEKASKECGADTLFALLLSRPGLFDAASHRRETLQ